jgi:hypothetical protein
MRLAQQVAFLTGQSDPTRCALSPVQAGFLDALPIEHEARVRQNFPYDQATLPHWDVPLLEASWQNTRQYLRSGAPAFAAMYRPIVLNLLDRADRTTFLAGSCGTELLFNLALPDAALARVRIFGYGAFGRRPRCEALWVRGTRDWIAGPWGRPGDVLVTTGHRDYLENPRVRELCCGFIEEGSLRRATPSA